MTFLAKSTTRRMALGAVEVEGRDVEAALEPDVLDGAAEALGERHAALGRHDVVLAAGLNERGDGDVRQAGTERVDLGEQRQQRCERRLLVRAVLGGVGIGDVVANGWHRHHARFVELLDHFPQLGRACDQRVDHGEARDLGWLATRRTVTVPPIESPAITMRSHVDASRWYAASASVRQSSNVRPMQIVDRGAVTGQPRQLDREACGGARLRDAAHRLRVAGETVHAQHAVRPARRRPGLAPGR